MSANSSTRDGVARPSTLATTASCFEVHERYPMNVFAIDVTVCPFCEGRRRWLEGRDRSPDHRFATRPRRPRPEGFASMR